MIRARDRPGAEAPGSPIPTPAHAAGLPDGGMIGPGKDGSQCSFAPSVHDGQGVGAGGAEDGRAVVSTGVEVGPVGLEDGALGHASIGTTARFYAHVTPAWRAHG